MNICSVIQSVSDLIKHTIQDPAFIATYRIHENDFTRKRVLQFQDIMTFILSLPKKNLTFDLENFLEQLFPGTVPSYSKQAFSKARYKISWQAFQELFLSVTHLLLEQSPPALWHGFRVIAVDGTTIQLPQSPSNFRIFGGAATTSLTRVSALVDVGNDLLLDAVMEEYSCQEPDQACQLIQEWMAYSDRFPAIFLFDRNYNNYSLLEQLWVTRQKFVIRCKGNFPKYLTSVKEKEFPYFIGHLKRYVIPLNDFDEPEYLLTNLIEPEFEPLMKELYHMRWGIEKKYNELKNRISIQTFTGHKEDALFQDFFSNLLFSNIACFIKNYCDLQREEKEANGPKKPNKYQTNLSNVIMRLWTCYLKLLLRKPGWKKRLIKIIKQSGRDTSIIRPNRERKKRPERHLKQPYNYKTAL